MELLVAKNDFGTWNIIGYSAARGISVQGNLTTEEAEQLRDELIRKVK